VPLQHWIAGQARNDKPAARNDKCTRNDKSAVIPDLIRGPQRRKFTSQRTIALALFLFKHAAK
jgi:hypothetical protein